MLNIEKEFKDGCMVYHFNGSIEAKDLEKIEAMVQEDCTNTYTFVLDLMNIKQLSANAVTTLKKLYLASVASACEMVICGLNAQPKMMLEILQATKLFALQPNVQTALNSYKGNDNAFYHY